MEERIERFRAERMAAVVPQADHRALQMSRNRSFAATSSKALSMRSRTQCMVLKAVETKRTIVSMNPGYASNVEEQEPAAAECDFDVSRLHSLPQAESSGQSGAYTTVLCWFVGRYKLYQYALLIP